MKHTNVKEPSTFYKLGVTKKPYRMSCDYVGDGIGTKGKSLACLNEPSFLKAWTDTTSEIYSYTGAPTPDIRWRAHIAVWAAKQGLAHSGDFVECGVHTGILSGVICRALGWENIDRRFWLFDTWAGVPTIGLDGQEAEVAHSVNKDYHKADIFAGVKNAFSSYENVNLVRGNLPHTLLSAEISSISYLSIDLNSAKYEKECIEILWPKLCSGAVVLLDDYNFSEYHLQQDMWDNFASSYNLMVAALPTGQGLIIKP